MSTFYTLEPEVAGELGPKTDMDTTKHPPVVHSLQYVFSDWLGDDLVTSFPVFMVSEPLAKEITGAGLHGFELTTADVATSPEFKELQDPKNLPVFLWLKITGQAGQDDFGLINNQLMVSAKALDVLKRGRLDQCQITPV